MHVLYASNLRFENIYSKGIKKTTASLLYINYDGFSDVDVMDYL